MKGRRNPLVAAEGIPFLVVSALAAFAVLQWLEPAWLVLPLGLFVLFVLVFRDPRRSIPAVPLGAVSPVDGRVLEAGASDRAGNGGGEPRVLIRVDAAGTYTARSPVEGKVMDLATAGRDAKAVAPPKNALWVRTDEGDDVVLSFESYRLGLPPKSLLRYGERVGQGARCAYLRLVRLAEVRLPAGAKVVVSPGDRLIAGRDVIARLPQP